MNTWLTRLALKKQKKLEKGRVSAEEPGSPRGQAAASGEAWGGQTGGTGIVFRWLLHSTGDPSV